MASRTLKRYGLESAAKILIAVGLLLALFSWIVGVYDFGFTGKLTLFIVPFIFTCVFAVLLLASVAHSLDTLLYMHLFHLFLPY